VYPIRTKSAEAAKWMKDAGHHGIEHAAAQMREREIIRYHVRY
jgi:hypothetical protein